MRIKSVLGAPSMCSLEGNLSLFLVERIMVVEIIKGLGGRAQNQDRTRNLFYHY